MQLVLEMWWTDSQKSLHYSVVNWRKRSLESRSDMSVEGGHVMIFSSRTTSQSRYRPLWNFRVFVNCRMSTKATRKPVVSIWWDSVSCEDVCLARFIPEIACCGFQWNGLTKSLLNDILFSPSRFPFSACSPVIFKRTIGLSISPNLDTHLPYISAFIKKSLTLCYPA